MNRELLDLLCDPVNKEPLTLIDECQDDRGRIVSGQLEATSGVRYPIVDGIPRFVSDAVVVGSVHSFGKEWNFFNYTGFKADWLLHAVANTFGSTDVFRGELIVDAGGGSGAQTLWMLESGAKHVVMLELSDTVDNVVQRNLKPSGFTNYDIVQCSIDSLPLKPNSIDGIVYCHNVIQHTPSVEKTAAELFSAVAPGGEFVFNCYPLNDGSILRWIRYHLIYKSLRRVLSRSPFVVILGYSRLMGFLRQIPVVGFILEKTGFCLRGDVPPRLEDSWWDRIRRKYRTTVLITFDWFGAHEYQHHKSDDEIRELIKSLQPNPEKIKNLGAYFSRPKPIGCALRIFK